MDIDGDAHGKMYLELAEGKEQSPLAADVCKECGVQELCLNFKSRVGRKTLSRICVWSLENLGIYIFEIRVKLISKLCRCDD
jgi:hypothetical protein